MYKLRRIIRLSRHECEPEKELKAALPRSLSPTALPEIAWGPLGGGLLMLVVGLIGVLAGQPWLFPSLGPTAYLQVENPAHPTSRIYNVIVGHMVGLAAGFAGVAIAGAWAAPVVLFKPMSLRCRGFGQPPLPLSSHS